MLKIVVGKLGEREQPTTKLSFFDEDQFKLVRQIVDIILPATDSPAASEVGVHHTIDSMVGTIVSASGSGMVICR